MEPVLCSYQLAEGLVAEVRDETIHYFGGYFHVKISLTVVVPVVESMFAVPEEWRDARMRLGDTVRFERILEKMAVPEHELASVKQQLLHACESNQLPYLRHPDFARRFVAGRYRELLKMNRSRFGRQHG
jgi:hypothetical protein